MRPRPVRRRAPFVASQFVASLFVASLLAACSQPAPSDLEALRAELAADPAAVQRVLLDPKYADGARDERPFRRLVHDAAVAHGVSRLALVADDEPGEHVEVHGRTVDGGGAPVAGVAVYVFATDAEGRYHPTIEGERVPRIFGTVVSDADGRFVIETVRPGPYPGTRNPRHLHVDARKGERRLAAPGYIVFDDDPLLFEPQNAEPRGEAIRIAMRGARGEVTLPLR